MRTLAICAALSCAAFGLVAASNRLTDTDLTVHEWGTFTSVPAPDGTPADWNALGCGDDLPRFVKDSGSRNLKFTLSATVRMETPVLYFYSTRNLDAAVKASFPNGRITEWYPKADQSGPDIEWKSVKVRPGEAPEFPVESSPSRYYAARATDSAPLSAGGQSEKFLFYRGVANASVPLSARAEEDGRIAVTNTITDSLPMVILFENRGGAIGYRNAGSVEKSATLERPTLDAPLPELKAGLESSLIAQGLYPKEAAAMIDTWRDSWFEEGSRLIYILPESAVNAMVPLEIDPAPSRISRVFVGRIELMTPETKRAVREAIAKNDRHTLALYRRFLEPIGKSIGETVNFPCEAADGR